MGDELEVFEFWESDDDEQNTSLKSKMGGCRCTYKNCSLRTDKVTHMFHYPVFDKLRCHQWLTNAQKLEFLDLKVSQLKNRVVCQHHFKDDYFMNFLKDKLTFDAVPTLDGPYCDTSPENNSVRYETKHYNIALEDIENEYLTYNEKKENFSVKYADFLTNGDLMDFDLNNQTDNRQLLMADNGNQFNENNTILYGNANTKIIDQPINKNNFNLETKSNNVYTIEFTEVPIEIQNDLPITNFNVPIPPITETTNQKAKNKHKDNSNKSKSMLTDKKIIILNEQNICDNLPGPLPLQLEPVNPSAVLTLPNKKRNRSYLLENANNKNNAPNTIEINNIVILGKDKKHIDYVKNEAVDNEIVNVNLDCNNMQQVDISMSQFSNNIINDSNFVTTNNVINDSNVITTNILLNDSNVMTTNNVINDSDAMTINNVINDSNIVTTKNFINDSNVATTDNVINPGNYMNTGSYINVGDVINTADVVTADIINNSNIITDAVIDKRSVTNIKKYYTRSASNKSKNAKNLNPNSVLNSNSLLNNTSFINKSDVNINDENTRSVAGHNKKNNSVKNKIPPERIAAIQEKRKFNMKLRDIIADCLDKLDDNESSNCNNSKLQTQQEQLSQKVGSYLAKEPELPNMPEYTVAYLEARIDKMEKLLLKKIDNNSQRILDLKNSLAPTVNKQSMSTQTCFNEEERKKQLYKEISQYLSTDANSLLYEELFIDKFVPKKARYSPRKKTKMRYF